MFVDESNCVKKHVFVRNVNVTLTPESCESLNHIFLSNKQPKLLAHLKRN